MKSLIENPTIALKWRKTGLARPDYELAGNDGVYATLSLLNEEHTLARVKTHEGAWTLKHMGVMNPVVTLREEGGTTNLATFHPHVFRHGSLEFADGASFWWTWLHGEEPGGTFLDSAGNHVVRLQAQAGTDLSATADFELGEVGLSPVLPTQSRSALLAAFGWYMILFDHLKEQDAAAAETALRL